ncbi:MAG: outer membrane lipoprotein-sorting protein [Opitutales bacterium]
MSITFSVVRLGRRWVLWLCLAVVTGMALETVSHAQRRFTPRPAPYSELDYEQGKELLSEFRQIGIAGDYTFQFELRSMPRRGQEALYQGNMWGSRNTLGPISLIEITSENMPEETVRLLVQNGVDAAIWTATRNSEGEFDARKLGVDDLFSPILNTDYTPFDLQMPYIYWQDFEYDGLERIRGRSSHRFIMFPPAELQEQFPDIAGVRIYLDAEFKAMIRAEMLDSDAEVLKTFSILDIKRVQGQWIVKTIDLRDDITRDKTRFRVTDAVMDLFLPGLYFSPENLDNELPPSQWVREFSRQ